MAEQFIEGLRSEQLSLRMVSAPRPNSTTVHYDATYGFPSSTWDRPDVRDEDVTISVVSFTRPGAATPSPAAPSR